jgi:osmoprotectant transport system permease protein
VTLLNALLTWFGDPAHWTGTGGVPNRLLQHLYISGVALLIGCVIALPLGAYVGHTGHGGFMIVGVANGVRALPELGLLYLFALALGVGTALPAYFALAILAIPPVMAGTYAGVRNVDRAVVDAARGMGMRERQVLFKVELPNALPLILSGLRAASFQVIATAAIAAFIAQGGLGRYLQDGFRRQQYGEMAAGALLVGALALVIEGILLLVQFLVVSPGLRAGGGARRSPTADLAASEAESAPEVSSPEPELAGVD